MRESVTTLAQRNQVLFGIASAMTAKFQVMNLEALPAAAVLTLPVVALEDLPLQTCISCRF